MEQRQSDNKNERDPEPQGEPLEPEKVLQDRSEQDQPHSSPLEQPSQERPEPESTGQNIATPVTPGDERAHQETPGLERPEGSESDRQISASEIQEETGSQTPDQKTPDLSPPGLDRPGSERPDPEKPGHEITGQALTDQEIASQEEPGQEEPGQERLVNEQPSLETAGPDRLGHERPVNERPSRERAGQDRASNDRSRQERPGQERPGQDRPGQDRPRQERTGQDRQDRSGRDRRGGDRTVQDQSNPERQEKPVQDRSNPERQERPGQDRPSGEKSGSERQGQDRQNNGRPGNERTGQDRPGQDRPGQDRQGVERISQDRPIQDRSGQERAGHDRLSHDRPAQDRTGGDKPMGDAPGQERLVIGITLGDYNGIGPEVILKALQNGRLQRLFTPVIYGSMRVLNRYRNILQQSGLPLKDWHLNGIQSIAQVNHKFTNVISCWNDQSQEIQPGKVTPEAGQAALACLQRATEDLKAGQLHALVTAPINKYNIQTEEFKFPGHTEFLADAFGVPDNLMFLVSEVLRVGVVTGHIPLGRVRSSLTREKILQKFQLMSQSLKNDFGIRKPRIAVLGLNPHAGEEGLLGIEEQEIIKPLLQELRNKGHLVYGPFPADGFFGTRSYRKYDAVLAMYHDQGLIPFKTIAFEEGVNFTAGMPVVRTSPDHGTAYDIAGKNLADETSMLQALYLACDVARYRREMAEIDQNALNKSEVLKNSQVQ